MREIEARQKADEAVARVVAAERLAFLASMGTRGHRQPVDHPHSRIFQVNEWASLEVNMGLGCDQRSEVASDGVGVGWQGGWQGGWRHVRCPDGRMLVERREAKDDVQIAPMG